MFSWRFPQSDAWQEDSSVIDTKSRLAATLFPCIMALNFYIITLRNELLDSE
jgi:hypothetical protein